MQEIVKNSKIKKEKEIVKSKTGITLIALVVTVIVLLILAGVTIATLTGNNGIIIQAKQAKENNNSETVKEKVEVEILKSIDKKGNLDENTFEKNVTENIKGSTVTKSGNSLIVKADGYEVTVDKESGEVTEVAKSDGETPTTGVTPGIEVSKTEKDNYTDSNKEKATIPEGFTVDEKENTISKGLVVHGPDKANGDNGSEFVWVPVPDINSMSQCSKAGGSCNLELKDGVLKCTTHNSVDIVGKLYATELGENFGTVNTTYSADNGLREPAIVKDYDNNTSYNTIGLTLSEMQENYKNMATSIAKYGGFYVGRYEISLSDATVSSTGTSGTAQSKQGVIPISAGNSVTSSWYGLYSKQKEYTGKNGSVESSMIWGSQYDTMLNWVKNGADKDKITNRFLGNNSSEIVTTTGNSMYSDDSINNIRDLGGNLLEWTLEADGANRRVLRGGMYYCTSLLPSSRSSYYPGSSDSNYGSRLTLYIK